MTMINEYLSTISGIRTERIGVIVDYIRTKYPNTTETLDFSPKIKFPTFKLKWVT